MDHISMENVGSIVFVTMTLLHSWKNIEAKALKYLRVGLGEQLLPS